MSVASAEFAGVPTALKKIPKTESPSDYGKSHLSSHFSNYPGPFALAVEWKAVSSDNCRRLE